MPGANCFIFDNFLRSFTYSHFLAKDTPLFHEAGYDKKLVESVSLWLWAVGAFNVIYLSAELMAFLRNPQRCGIFSILRHSSGLSYLLLFFHICQNFKYLKHLSRDICSLSRQTTQPIQTLQTVITLFMGLIVRVFDEVCVPSYALLSCRISVFHIPCYSARLLACFLWFEF